MEEEARGQDALLQKEERNITTKVNLILSNNATPETLKNTTLKPKKKKFKKKDHALLVARVVILLYFVDSENVILTLRKTLPKNLPWQ